MEIRGAGDARSRIGVPAFKTAGDAFPADALGDCAAGVFALEGNGERPLAGVLGEAGAAEDGLGGRDPAGEAVDDNLCEGTLSPSTGRDDAGFELDGFPEPLGAIARGSCIMR